MGRPASFTTSVLGTPQLTRDLPTLAPGDEMTYASADMRGSGSSIEDNIIEKVPGRIYLGASSNVT